MVTNQMGRCTTETPRAKNSGPSLKRMMSSGAVLSCPRSKYSSPIMAATSAHLSPTSTFNQILCTLQCACRPSTKRFRPTSSAPPWTPSSLTSIPCMWSSRQGTLSPSVPSPVRLSPCTTWLSPTSSTMATLKPFKRWRPKMTKA
jgi:hypothetical protein